MALVLRHTFLHGRGSQLVFHITRVSRRCDNAIPTDNQIRSLLDPVEPSTVFPVYEKVFSFLEEKGTIEAYRSFENNLLIALDGTWFHSSEKVFCEHCNWKEHRNGKTTYYHSVITRWWCNRGTAGSFA